MSDGSPSRSSAKPATLPESLQRDPRVYFAAERTYLAWLRTGLALMGFGFVVARFGLFLKEIAATQPGLGIRSSGFSLGVGTGLILIGVLVNVTSTVSHYRVIERLNRGESAVGHPSVTAMAVAAMMALLGLGMAAYLVIVR
jgi:putative membrane protein